MSDLIARLREAAGPRMLDKTDYSHESVVPLADIERIVTEWQGEQLVDQLTEDEAIRRVTRAVRASDEAFEKSGGSSRHWVRDWFLPYLRQEGLEVCAYLAPPKEAADVRD